MKSWRQIASETANEALDDLKEAHDREWQRERKWQELCEKAIRGEEAVIYYAMVKGDYRIRLVAEPLP